MTTLPPGARTPARRLVRRKLPRWFTWNTISCPSSVITAELRKATPALFTRMSSFETVLVNSDAKFLQISTDQIMQNQLQ